MEKEKGEKPGERDKTTKNQKNKSESQNTIHFLYTGAGSSVIRAPTFGFNLLATCLILGQLQSGLFVGPCNLPKTDRENVEIVAQLEIEKESGLFPQGNNT